MYIIGTFEYSPQLEIVVTELIMIGIDQKKILALPLDKRTENSQLFDSIHYSDGVSLVDLAGVLGCIGMLLGSIYGFRLSWGPIIWAVVGLILGLTLGFLIKLFVIKIKYKGQLSNSKTEVILITFVNEEKEQKVKELLWQHKAFGLTTYSS